MIGFLLTRLGNLFEVPFMRPEVGIRTTAGFEHPKVFVMDPVTRKQSMRGLVLSKAFLSDPTRKDITYLFAELKRMDLNVVSIEGLGNQVYFARDYPLQDEYPLLA